MDLILEHLDADPLTGQEHGKVGDLWFMNRFKKVASSIDGALSQIVGEDFGQNDVSWDNIEQVYNPMVSGVHSIED